MTPEEKAGYLTQTIMENYGIGVDLPPIAAKAEFQWMYTLILETIQTQ